MNTTMEQHCQRCFKGTAVFDYVVEKPRLGFGTDGGPPPKDPSPQNWKLCTQCREDVRLFAEDILE